MNFYILFIRNSVFKDLRAYFFLVLRLNLKTIHVISLRVINYFN
jgi:hypothetical protein